MKKVEIYVWVDEKYWFKKKQELILQAFKPIKIKKDIAAAIGAGASGPLPEVNLLIVIPGIIATGLLTAVGEDIWKAIKSGVKLISSVKPDRPPPSPIELHLPLESDLIWWMQFKDKQILIMVNTHSAKELDQALDKLPSELDKAVKKGDNFVRAIWVEGKWKFI